MFKLLLILWIPNIVQSTRPNVDTCNQFREAFYDICGNQTPISSAISQGAPGKRGPKGVKGDVGPTGPQTQVDYDSINNNIHTSISKGLKEMSSRISSSNAKLDKVYSRWEKEFCPVYYRDRCFRIIVHFEADVAFNEAQFLCESVGWRLGNIYNATHYRLVESYMRSRISTTSDATMRAWTAMTWNKQTNSAQLTTGDFLSANNAMWHQGYPTSESSHTRIGIMFRSDASDGRQGIYNYPPALGRHGAFCEL